VAPAMSEATPHREFVVRGEESAVLSASPARACSLTHATLATTGASIPSKKEARPASAGSSGDQYPARRWSCALRVLQL